MSIRINEAKEASECRETDNPEKKEVNESKANEDEIREKNREKLENDRSLETETGEKKELSENEKIELKQETGWSDEVVDNIRSPKEAEIYKDAELEEKTIEGKECLIKKDIDMSQKDEFGLTNEERIKEGKAPIDKDGNYYELHHIGQKMDSPLAELSREEHRGKGNDAILHEKTKESEIDRVDFASERKAHWEGRYDMLNEEDK